MAALISSLPRKAVHPLHRKSRTGVIPGPACVLACLPRRNARSLSSTTTASAAADPPTQMPDKPAATDVDPPTLPAASPDQPSANTAQLSASADEHMLIDSLADFVNTNPNFFDALLLADFSQQQQQQHVPAPQMDEAMQAAVALVQHQSTPVGEVLPSLDAFELDAADPNSTAVFDELLFAQHHSHQSYRQQQHRASEQQESSPAASNTSTRRSILKCERPPDYLLRMQKHARTRSIERSMSTILRNLHMQACQLGLDGASSAFEITFKAVSKFDNTVYQFTNVRRA